MKSGIFLAPVTNSSKRNTPSRRRTRYIPREPEAHAVYLFRKLSRLLRANRTAPEARSVHLLRTTIRRIQTLAQSLGEEKNKPFAKLDNLLKEIFEKAGRVRDLDVQLDALHNISLPSIEEDKRLLLNYLQRQRAKRAKKLATLVEDELAGRLQRRQTRAKALILEKVHQRSDGTAKKAVDLHKEVAPLLAQLHHGNFDTTSLHELRLVVKHVRYAAEAAGEAQAVTLLKPAQDAIGIWHDWINLIDTADEVLGPLPGHPLMTILRGKIRARFNDAVAALKPLEAQLSELLEIGKRPGPVLVVPNVPLASAATAG
ncbi:hypothetical protein Acid345_3329 [Candidatus Koribacter versatilis Ellin345]|uniref:CHAD domain-containing protein n=1 Tax=Koribacter versatilis (strain Ellin345) TaxID=204669 RepID=Q1ILC0_KORVE|nr:hypothetical protein Acid345_3329 [Candidatus Koribacter versatilis Ellin345]